MAFPIINTIRDMESLRSVEGIHFNVLSNGVTIVSYLANFSRIFDNLLTLEARGITFDSQGRVISRPIHKFFNLNERETTLRERIDFSRAVRVMDKKDGSMIHTVIAGNGLSPLAPGRRFEIKTKSAFDSDVANIARRWIVQWPNYLDFCDECARAGLTAIFEWVSPDSIIVISYPKEGLTLLHIRKNATGEYLGQAEIEKLAEKYEIPIIGSEAVDPQRLVELSAELENKEGWVVQFEDGEMIKIKTQWYLKRHGVMTMLRERDVALAALHEKLDDIKSMLVGDGIDISGIDAVEKRVATRLFQLMNTVETVYNQHKHLSRKEFAILLKDDAHFSLLMEMYQDRKPDYVLFFERKILKNEFSLRLIHFRDSVADSDV